MGVEAAKNIILGGVKKVTLWDNQNAEWTDLGAQFYLAEFDVNESVNRALASFRRLKELNPYVNVELLQSPDLPESAIADHNVLLVTDTIRTMKGDESQLIALGDTCRKHDTALIVADVAGLAGRLFCDFGNKFVIKDKDGIEPKRILISTIVRDGDTLIVATHDETPHDFEIGDYVQFTKIKGLDGLVEKEFQIISVTGPHAFVVSSEGVVGAHSLTSGWVQLVKKPFEVDFEPIRTSIESPGEFILTDGGKRDRPATYHACFRALFKYFDTHKELPKPHDKDDASKFVELVTAGNPNVETDVATRFAFTCRARLQPASSAVGAMAAQEAVKAITGKFSPIRQWWYLCLQECLPTADVTDAAIVNTRYASQIACFGLQFQEKMLKQKWFIVGAGAIGCELLKNFAMMGVGDMVVTDPDTIERSNLNRQFLFRSSDVGKYKVSSMRAKNAHLSWVYCQPINGANFPMWIGGWLEMRPGTNEHMMYRMINHVNFQKFTFSI